MLTLAAQRPEEVSVHALPAVFLENADRWGNPGLWGWLSLFYFDALCASVPGAMYRYLPETTGATAGLRYYRHLLAGPYRLYQHWVSMPARRWRAHHGSTTPCTGRWRTTST